MPGSKGMHAHGGLDGPLSRATRRRSWPGWRVRRVRDYLALMESRAGRAAAPFDGPRGDMVMLDLAAEGTYVAVRPSGTEPKVKFYMFTYEPAEQLANLEDAQADARRAAGRDGPRSDGVCRCPSEPWRVIGSTGCGDLAL